MKIIKQIPIGSCVFFSQMDGFKPKDYDYVCFVDNYPFDIKPCMRLTLGENELMIYQNLTKDEFIGETLECELNMKAGKFLVPEFVEHIGFTINELPLFERMFNDIDEPHKYEKLIYDDYVSNGGFFLTDQQRKSAYDEYLKYRQLI